MQAFHSFWSMPNYLRNQGEIGYPDFELLTAILSALKWQQKNGKIKMITDTRGAEFFESVGLKNLWNEVDTSLDHLDLGVDPFLFWAAGKIYALKTMDLPCVMLDTDLIIWEKLVDFGKFDVVAAHEEELYEAVYPDHRIFQFKEGYEFPEDWDFRLNAANTAFLYLKNPEFRDYYVDAAIDIFKYVKTKGLNVVTAMCFAEQRVLPMCAKAKQQNMGYLFDLFHANVQELATHTWGFKDILRASEEAHFEFCMRLTKRIMKDFPEREELLAESIVLNKYWKEYKRIVK